MTRKKRGRLLWRKGVDWLGLRPALVCTGASPCHQGMQDNTDDSTLRRLLRNAGYLLVSRVLRDGVGLVALALAPVGLA